MRLSLIPLAWLAVANAIPTTQQPEEPAAAAADDSARQSFTLPVRTNPDYVPDGPAEFAAARRKWNMPVPEALNTHLLTRRQYSCAFCPLSSPRANPSRQKAAIAQTTSAKGDSYWLTDIYVGHPEAQVIPVMIDSGTSNFWLMSTDTQFGDAAKNGKHTLYDPSKSVVSQEIPNVTWKTEYGDGSGLSGKVYFEQLRIGSSKDQYWFNITNATIQSVVSVSNRWAVDPNLSGVLGLSKRRAVETKPRFPSLLNRMSSHLHFPYIDVDLRGNSSLGYWGFGNSVGGGRDLINEPPMPNSDDWDFRIPRIRMTSMGDVEWLMYEFTATIDTGTTLVLLPPKLVASYYAEIPESSFDATLDSYLFPCSIASGIPGINFMTGGKYIGTIEKEHINLGPVPGDGERCYGGIQKSGSETHAIFGGVALKSMHVRFNFGTDQGFVSFGKKGMDVCSFTMLCK
ncbi:eukaryotic aspartyl protease [Colletotrichum musicola]|uniref:Eukaryotic aspartyl protease n=1 Tax=Colletotrichum musicola TaxID=2175873 RepID=A0A8H6NVC1_9PEZI|nr:eukaryotic aspartyl protease [Colletotrichum musicola]